MALRNIRKWDDPILRQPAKKVELADGKLDRRTLTIIDDMFDTMYDADGVGLAAPQVGILRQIIVIDTTKEGEKLVLINPEILCAEGEQDGPEGCLSFPGKFGNVRRPAKVTIRAIDRDGNVYERTGEGLLARAFCHEIDHLKGEVFIDKVEKWLE